MSAPPLLPFALKKGDRVAVISPSGPTRDPSLVEAGMARLRRWGLQPALGKHALNQLGYLAGTDEGRAFDLQTAIKDPEIRGIFCLRGGYGVTRVLDRIDFSPLRQYPKPIVGYSDVTALLAAAHRAVGLASLHGPMLAVTDHAFDERTEAMQRDLLFAPKPLGLLKTAAVEPQPHVITPGSAEGPLIGGNLSLLAALTGTKHAPDTTGAIIFLEDVNEEPYRVDRMLTQLTQTGFFAKAAGVIFGDFTKGEASAGTEQTDLEWVRNDRVGGFKIPAAFDFPFGHRAKSWTLPFGVRAKLDAMDPAVPASLTLLDPAVRAR